MERSPMPALCWAGMGEQSSLQADLETTYVTFWLKVEPKRLRVFLSRPPTLKYGLPWSYLTSWRPRRGWGCTCYVTVTLIQDGWIFMPENRARVSWVTASPGLRSIR